MAGNSGVQTFERPAFVRHTVEAEYGSTAAAPFRFRQRRFQHVQALIEQIIARKGSCRIADIGGSDYYWQIASDFVATAPVEIHLINPNASEISAKSHKFRAVIGDACNLGHIDDNAFDLVHSNSVIEHVGNWQRMSDMAMHARRLAPAYYVQTPYFWFPYEPHVRFPFYQFLPEQIRYRMLMTFNSGFAKRRTTLDHAMRDVQSASLLDISQLQALFPDARIERERVAFMTKSIMAIRQSIA